MLAKEKLHSGIIGITYPGNAAFEKFYQQASILFRWMKPRADASATLKQIKKSGLMLGLISDAAYEVPRLWEKHSLSRFFDVTIFSNKVHLKKPDPKIYLLACERLDVKPTECLYVGDGGSWELTGAEKVGMTSLQISSPEDDDS
jgi:putative hydrolase of the HAD superfamily